MPRWCFVLSRKSSMAFSAYENHTPPDSKVLANILCFFNPSDEYDVVFTNDSVKAGDIINSYELYQRQEIIPPL